MDWSQDNFKDESRPKLHELVKMADYKKHEGEFAAYRFVGNLTPIAQIWIPIYKDGKPLISEKTKKAIEIPFFVTNFDYKTGKMIEGKKCPFVELASYMSQFRDKPLNVSTAKLAQAINRMVQEENSDDEGRFRRRAKPSAKEQATGFKDAIDSPCRTPVEVHTIGYQLGTDFASVLALNKVKLRDPKTQEVKTVVKSIADPKHGCDVQIKFDGKIKGSKKTSAQKGDKSPLKPEEQAYLLWDLDKVLAKLVMKPEEAKAEAARILAEFKKSLKAGGSKRASTEPDEEDLPDDIEDDTGDLGLEDETPAPRRTQGGKPARKPAVVEDDGDLDFDEPAKPASKKPQGKPAQGKPAQRRPAPAVDDDEDIDALLGDDEGEDLEGLDGDDGDDGIPF